MNTRKRILLIAFVGAPSSVFAIVLSILAFLIVFENPRYGFLAFLGVGGFWAVFTGLRKLWIFDTAHLSLVWHDWVGGLFGIAINSFIILLEIFDLYEYMSGQHWEESFWKKFIILIYLSIVPLIFASIVIVRYFKTKIQNQSAGRTQ